MVPIKVSPSRRSVVHYADTLLYDQTSVITVVKSEQEFNYLEYLQSIDTDVWIALLILLVLLTFICTLIDRRGSLNRFRYHVLFHGWTLISITLLKRKAVMIFDLVGF